MEWWIASLHPPLNTLSYTDHLIYPHDHHHKHKILLIIIVHPSNKTYHPTQSHHRGGHNTGPHCNHKSPVGTKTLAHLRFAMLESRLTGALCWSQQSKGGRLIIAALLLLMLAHTMS